jgi:hypothetical protein
VPVGPARLRDRYPPPVRLRFDRHAIRATHASRFNAESKADIASPID